MIACLSDIFIGDASDISIGDLQVLSVCRSQRHLYRRDRGCSALRVTSNSRETVPARAKEGTDGTGVAAGRRNSAVSPTRSPTFSARSGVHSGGEHELRPRIGAQQLLGHCSCDSASWIVRICLQDDDSMATAHAPPGNSPAATVSPPPYLCTLVRIAPADASKRDEVREPSPALQLHQRHKHRLIEFVRPSPEFLSPCSHRPASPPPHRRETACQSRRERSRAG